MKTCTLCDETKQTSEFGKHKIAKDGLSSWCKECTRERARIYRDTAAGVYTALKGLNKFRNRKAVNISKENFVEWYDSQERVCVYCDLREEDLIYIVDSFNSMTHKLTVDCIENDVAYSDGNLVLACRRCNTVKNDIFTFDEMRYIGQNFLKPRWEEQLKTNKGEDNEMS